MDSRDDVLMHGITRIGLHGNSVIFRVIQSVPERNLLQSALVYPCHCLLILVFQLQEVCLALIDNRYFNEVFNHTDLSSYKCLLQ